jgi:hypothetical protein
MAITKGIALDVITSDVYSSRFELFSNAIVGQLEGGVPIVSTSASWDMGRDGRAVGRAGAIFICCSLADGVDGKAADDIARVTPHITAPAKIYFCSAQKLSEHRVVQIETDLKAMLPSSVTITVLGAQQLAELAVKWPEVANQQYKAEIEDCLRVLRDGDAATEADIPGLRLALVTAAHDDSAAIRADVYKSGLLTVFADDKPRSVNEASKDLAAFLRLNHNLPTEAVAPRLKLLEDDKSLKQSSGKYSITQQGHQELATRNSAATQRLLAGRQLIRNALEASLGARFLDDHFARMWEAFEERMASYFYARGERMVQEVVSLVGVDIGATKPASPSDSSLSFIEDLADAVAATTANADQRRELKVAIKDLFSERTGPAADWLLRVCCGYVAACSLGLESSCGDALGKLFSKLTLVFDTDVVLSLICEGRADHAGVNAVATRWRKLGGKILCAVPVLDEVAYHAWIAENDFREVQRWLPGTVEERDRLIENAFVRSFAEHLATKKARLGQWKSFIEQYRGRKESDITKVRSELVGEYGMGELPPRSAEELSLELKTKDYLSSLAHAEHAGIALRNALGKATRDAALYAAMIRHLRDLRKSDPGAACLLVSSARRLQDLESKFAESGETHLVVSISSVLALLSLVPQVSLGVSALKAFLFDERRLPFSSEFERILLRVVRESEHLSMPWAKRGTLMRALRGKLIDEAKSAGVRVTSEGDIKRIEGKALGERNRPRTIDLFLQSIDAVAADSPAEIQNRELKRRIAQLESENERLKKKR